MARGLEWGQRPGCQRMMGGGAGRAARGPRETVGNPSFPRLPETPPPRVLTRVRNRTTHRGLKATGQVRSSARGVGKRGRGGSAPLKALVGVACAPRPWPRPAPCAAPRGFPEPLCGAGGVGQEGGRRGRQRQARGLRTGRQKAGIPPLPAASRPLGNFPRLGTSPAGLTPLRRRDPAVSRRSEELEKETSWRCGEAGTVPSGNSPCRPATAYPSQRGRPFS